MLVNIVLTINVLRFEKKYKFGRFYSTTKQKSMMYFLTCISSELKIL